MIYLNKRIKSYSRKTELTKKDQATFHLILHRKAPFSLDMMIGIKKGLEPRIQLPIGSFVLATGFRKGKR